MNNLKGTLPGIMIVLLITMVSFMLSLIHPSFDILVISIIFGMLAANFIKDRGIFDKGISFALKVFLPAGIALYGTQLSFARTELKFGVAVIITFIAMFTLTYFISRGIGLKKNVCILLSTGLSICGASAIAVVSPLIKAEKEETSISLIAVMALGLAGMIVYPLLIDILVLNENEFAFLTGATLPMMGQVKVAASSAGTDVLALALKLKLIRISCLIFLPIVAMTLSGRGNRFYVPWFISVFIVFAIGVNVLKDAGIIVKMAEPVSKFLLSSTLAAIGLSVDIESIAEEGIKPLLSVFLSWGIVVLLIYLIFSMGI
jgi:uncharacterized integral membrane protein (TIGR00698 family)